MEELGKKKCEIIIEKMDDGIFLLFFGVIIFVYCFIYFNNGKMYIF